MTAPEEIRYDADGLAVAALAWGSPDGRLALCLHGYPDTAHSWRHLGPHLAERGFRVVAPFARGYHPTALAPDGRYQIGALAHDALAARRVLGGEDAVLIGHDWGAIAGWTAAAADPEAFSRTVLMSVPPLGVVLDGLRPRRIAADLPLALRQVRNSWYIFFQQLPGVSDAAVERLIPHLWKAWSPAYDGRDDVAHALAALPDAEHRAAALEYYRAMLQPWRRSPDYTEEATAWRMPESPALYLHGEDDGCVDVAFVERVAAVMPAPGRTEVVRGAGHFLQLEQPARVNELIAGYIT